MPPCQTTRSADHDLPLDCFDLSEDEVRRRFRWAVRQGNPQWLWPTIRIEGWQSALGQIERATRHILAGRRAPASLDGPADDIGIAAFTSGMGPLLGYWAGEGLLEADPAVAPILQLHYIHNRRRMERLTRHTSTAVEALAAAGVSVTVLKGMHTAHSYFPEPGTRPTSDIDLLINPSEHPAAAEVLRELGYLAGKVSSGEQSWYLSGTPTVPRSLSLTHHANPWNIDLHVSLNRRYSPGSPTMILDPLVGECARPPWPPMRRGTVLPSTELLLHLAFHASTPFLSLTMVRLTELVLVIESIKADRTSFWDRFSVLSEQTGAAAGAYPALYFADALVPGTVPQPVLHALAGQAPAAVRQVVSRLTPATCQAMQRCSLKERFMWVNTFGGWVREARTDLFPSRKPREMLEIYAMRFRRLARGAVTR